MLENVLVGVILLAAAAFTVYRLFFRPSCGCEGCSGASSGGCACSAKDDASGLRDLKGGACGGSGNKTCCCGK